MFQYSALISGLPSNPQSIAVSRAERQGVGQRVIFRPNGRIANVEAKVDSLADQSAELSHMTENSHSPAAPPSRDHSDNDRTCLTAESPGTLQVFVKGALLGREGAASEER